MKNIIIQLQAYELSQKFCAYDVLDQHGNLIFKGACRTCDIALCRDLLSKKSFEKSEHITIMTNCFFDTLKAAQDYNHIWMRQNFQPKYNTVYNHHKTYAIQCNETGVLYKNQTQAARALDLPQSQLSNHLNDKPGFKTVKGYTFKHVEVTQDILKEL